MKCPKCKSDEDVYIPIDNKENIFGCDNCGHQWNEDTRVEELEALNAELVEALEWVLEVVNVPYMDGEAQTSIYEEVKRVLEKARNV